MLTVHLSVASVFITVPLPQVSPGAQIGQPVREDEPLRGRSCWLVARCIHCCAELLLRFDSRVRGQKYSLKYTLQHYGIFGQSLLCSIEVR